MLPMWHDIDALRQSGARPHYFGLGFIQLKLSRAHRLHFWVPEWPVIPGAFDELHNHRYDFHSSVLKGSLAQKVYSIGPIKTSGDHEDWEVIQVGCSSKEESEPQVIGYTMPHLVLEHRICAGQDYFLSQRAFHVANPCDDTTITLVKPGEVQEPMALVVRPQGNGFTCPFSLGYTEEECWKRIEVSLRGH